MENSKRKLLNVMRWILIFPSSVLSLFVVYALVYIGNHIFNYGGANGEWIIKAVSSFFSAAAFVFVGAIVSPSGHKIVSIVLSTTFILVMLLSILLSFGMYVGWSLFDQVVYSLISIVGCIVSSVYVHEEYSENK